MNPRTMRNDRNPKKAVEIERIDVYDINFSLCLSASALKDF